jgi:cell division septation protein DedD
VETPVANPTSSSANEPTAADSTAAGSGRAKPVVEPPPPAALTVVDPKPGQVFLQVSAITRPEAELLVEVLQKKGFRALLAPGPKDNIFRVLVGPERDDSELAKTRTALEQSGFKPIPRRY